MLVESAFISILALLRDRGYKWVPTLDICSDPWGANSMLPFYYSVE